MAATGSQQVTVDGRVLALTNLDKVLYPAAGLVHAFGGDRLVLINKEPTGMDHLATLVLHAAIGETLGAAMDQIGDGSNSVHSDG